MVYLPISLYFLSLDFRGQQHAPFIYQLTQNLFNRIINSQHVPHLLLVKASYSQGMEVIGEVYLATHGLRVQNSNFVLPLRASLCSGQPGWPFHFHLYSDEQAQGSLEWASLHTHLTFFPFLPQLLTARYSRHSLIKSL